MLKILFILLFYLLSDTVHSGNVNIRIIKNEDGFQTPVQSLLRVKDGANFSLNCEVFDTKSEKLLYDKIFWSKGKLKFTDECSWALLMKNNIVADANLNFTSITVKHLGNYFCASPKHKLVKAVSVIVRPGFETKVHGLKNSVFRHKRFVDNYAEDIPIAQKFEWPKEVDEIMELHKKEMEEKRKRDEEEFDRTLHEIPRKKEGGSLSMPVKITIAVVVSAIAIALGIWLSIRRLRQRRRLLQAFQEAENTLIEARQMGDRVRRLEEQTTQLGDRQNIRPREEVANGHTHMSHKGSIDLPPPSYHDAVEGVEPSAPPGDKASAPPANDSHLSTSKY